MPFLYDCTASRALLLTQDFWLGSWQTTPTSPHDLYIHSQFPRGTVVPKAPGGFLPIWFLFHHPLLLSRLCYVSPFIPRVHSFVTGLSTSKGIMMHSGFLPASPTSFQSPSQTSPLLLLFPERWLFIPLGSTQCAPLSEFYSLPW